MSNIHSKIMYFLFIYFRLYILAIDISIILKGRERENMRDEWKVEQAIFDFDRRKWKHIKNRRRERKKVVGGQTHNNSVTLLLKFIYHNFYLDEEKAAQNESDKSSSQNLKMKNFQWERVGVWRKYLNILPKVSLTSSLIDRKQSLWTSVPIGFFIQFSNSH